MPLGFVKYLRTNLFFSFSIVQKLEIFGVVFDTNLFSTFFAIDYAYKKIIPLHNSLFYSNVNFMVIYKY